MTVFNYWTVAKSKLCTSAAGVLSPDFQTWLVKCTGAMKMAFSAQLTEQGQAQGLSGERGSEKEQHRRGDGCRVHLPLLPPNKTSAVHAARVKLCQPVCLNFKHSSDVFPPLHPTNSPNRLRSGSCCPHSYTCNSPTLFPVRVSHETKPGFLNVRMYLS